MGNVLVRWSNLGCAMVHALYMYGMNDGYNIASRKTLMRKTGYGNYQDTDLLMAFCETSEYYNTINDTNIRVFQVFVSLTMHDSRALPTSCVAVCCQSEVPHT